MIMTLSLSCVERRQSLVNSISEIPMSERVVVGVGNDSKGGIRKELCVNTE